VSAGSWRLWSTCRTWCYWRSSLTSRSGTGSASPGAAPLLGGKIRAGALRRCGSGPGGAGVVLTTGHLPQGLSPLEEAGGRPVAVAARRPDALHGTRGRRAGQPPAGWLGPRAPPSRCGDLGDPAGRGGRVGTGSAAPRHGFPSLETGRKQCCEPAPVCTAVIPATWNAEMRRVEVRSQPWHIVPETPISKITTAKWRCGSKWWSACLQVRSPEYKLQPHKKPKKSFGLVFFFFYLQSDFFYNLNEHKFIW
jgi:hypothetical protein